MIPILYDNKETSFSSLGLGVLKDATSAIVTEERNGIFELEMKYSVDGKLFNELKNDRYIKIDANPNSKDQLFRIIRIDKPIKGEVTVYAEHVSYLSRDVALNPVVSYNGNAGSALNTWLDNLIDDTPFSVFSDILTVKSGTWNIEDYQNARNVLGGKQGSILQNYGGEYQFDNYHIMLWNERGENRGVPIVYGKNIIDLNQEEEINSTYTSIYPYRVYENENGNKIRITLTEKYIDGDYVDNYGHRKIKTVAFDDESITTEQALRNRAIQYVEDNNIGLPKVNITVNFIDLASTLNYKDRAVVEQIDLCDTLPVIYDKIGIETEAKIVKVTYDALRDRYETLEFGSIKSNLSQTITETVTQETERLDKEIEYVQISANGKNKIFRSETEPVEGMSENDLWYKPVGAGETELYRYTGTMWSLEKVSAGLLGGTIDAGSGDLDVINLNASSIVTGTLDALLVNVINLNADNIISGTIDADLINVINLNADNIKTGTLDAIDITGVNITGSLIDGTKITSTNNDPFYPSETTIDEGLFKNVSTQDFGIGRVTLGGGGAVFTADSRPGEQVILNGNDGINIWGTNGLTIRDTLFRMENSSLGGQSFEVLSNQLIRGRRGGTSYTYDFGIDSWSHFVFSTVRNFEMTTSNQTINTDIYRLDSTSMFFDSPYIDIFSSNLNVRASTTFSRPVNFTNYRPTYNNVEVSLVNHNHDSQYASISHTHDSRYIEQGPDGAGLSLGWSTSTGKLVVYRNNAYVGTVAVV